MKCARAQELYSGYFEGTIRDPERVALEQHFAECISCKLEYEKLRAAMAMVEKLPEVEPPPGFHAAVMARVEQARRATPHRVKWWQVEWGTALNVRVPVRAVAVGFAAILLMAMVVRLTPLSTVTAGWLPWSKSVSQAPEGVDDQENVKQWEPWGVGDQMKAEYKLQNSGMSVVISVDASSKARSMYAFSLQTASEKPVRFAVRRLAGGTICSDSLTSGQKKVIPVEVVREELSAEAVGARISWRYDGREFSVVAFLPRDFHPAGVSDKTFGHLPGGVDVYDALSAVAGKNGVVVVAPGDVDAATQVKWRELAPAVIAAEP